MNYSGGPPAEQPLQGHFAVDDFGAAIQGQHHFNRGLPYNDEQLPHKVPAATTAAFTARNNSSSFVAKSTLATILGARSCSMCKRMMAIISKRYLSRWMAYMSTR
jgi:hypothetical protein